MESWLERSRVDGGARRVEKAAVVAWIRFLRLSHRIGNALTEHLSAWGLTPAQYDVLAQLGRAEGLAQHELAARLAVTQGNICQLLHRLERSGLLVRRPEGRANHLYLTDEGRRLLAELLPEHQRLIAARFSGLTHAETRHLLLLLRKLDEGIADHPRTH